MDQVTLFKLDANNRVRVWTIWVEHHQNKSTVFTRHGINGGNLSIDRAEYTSSTHETQAIAHRVARIRYMSARKGYTETIPISRPFRPLLLQRWKNRQESTPNNIFIQPKLKGLRCLASKFWLKSRTGDHYFLPHIQEALSSLPEDMVLDGEVYCHGMSEQEITSRVKRSINTHPESHLISLFVFDIVEESLTYAERWEVLQEYFNTQPQPPVPVPVPVPTSTSHPPVPPCSIHPSAIEPHLTSIPGIYLLNTLPITQPEVDEHFNYYLSNGYEGAVIRNPYSHYQIDTRSPGVLKYKPYDTMNVKIIDIIPYVKKPELGKLILQNPRGGTFPVAYKATEIRKKQILNNKFKYIGCLCKVEFEDFSEDNVPLKAVGIHIYE